VLSNAVMAAALTVRRLADYVSGADIAPAAGRAHDEPSVAMAPLPPVPAPQTASLPSPQTLPWPYAPLPPGSGLPVAPPPPPQPQPLPWPYTAVPPPPAGSAAQGAAGWGPAAPRLHRPVDMAQFAPPAESQ
jgi:hypothetical protein